MLKGAIIYNTVLFGETGNESNDLGEFVTLLMLMPLACRVS